MSAQYATASTSLDAAARRIVDGDDDTAVALAVVGCGRMLAALAEEVEALVELLRERLPVPAAEGEAADVVAECATCGEDILPGQAIGFSGEALRHGWCTP